MIIRNVEHLNKGIYTYEVPKTLEFWDIPSEIVTNREYLSEMTEPCESLEEGELIVKKLFATLNHLNKYKKAAIGLAANQIGISKNVFVIDVIKPLYFINPDVIEVSEEKIRMNEGCMSIHKKKSLVTRNLKVLIKADNMSEPKWFGVDFDGGQLAEEAFESFAIQHEMNHLHGILIADIDEKPQPIVNMNIKFGRNEYVKIYRNDETIEIKFKKFEQYQKDGWKLKNI